MKTDFHHQALQLQTAPFGFSVIDEEGKVLFVNKTLEAMSGRKKGDLWGLRRDDQSQCPLCPTEAEIGPGEILTVDAENILGGKICRVHLLGVFFEGKKAYVEVFYDVTAQKETEKFFKGLAAVVEQTADSVMITDTQGAIEYVNSAFEEQTGFGRDEVMGRTSRILKSGHHDRVFYERLWKTILSGEPYREVMVNRRKNGEEYHIDKTITPILDEKGKISHFVSTDKDITQFKQMEEELAKIRLAEERLRTIRTLSVTYAHNIFNALSPAKAYAEMLLKEMEPENPKAQWLKSIVSSTETVVKIVNKLEKINAANVIEFGGTEIIDLEGKEKS